MAPANNTPYCTEYVLSNYIVESTPFRFAPALGRTRLAQSLDTGGCPTNHSLLSHPPPRKGVTCWRSSGRPRLTLRGDASAFYHSSYVRSTIVAAVAIVCVYSVCVLRVQSRSLNGRQTLRCPMIRSVKHGSMSDHSVPGVNHGMSGLVSGLDSIHCARVFGGTWSWRRASHSHAPLTLDMYSASILECEQFQR